jgi:hypothetical protein
MSKRTIASVAIVSAMLALTLCLPLRLTSLHAAAGDSPEFESPPQKAPESTAGIIKPAKGIDVIVHKQPDNTAVRTVTTNSAGHFTLPVLPIGSYSLKLDKGRGGFQVESSSRATTSHTSFDKTDTLLITIEGAAGGPIKAGWSFQTNATVDVSPPATDKTARKLRYHEYTPPGLTTIVVKSDGKTPLTGMVETTIVKSKSNIKNN